MNKITLGYYLFTVKLRIPDKLTNELLIFEYEEVFEEQNLIKARSAVFSHYVHFIHEVLQILGVPEPETISDRSYGRYNILETPFDWSGYDTEFWWERAE